LKLSEAENPEAPDAVAVQNLTYLGDKEIVSFMATPKQMLGHTWHLLTCSIGNARYWKQGLPAPFSWETTEKTNRFSLILIYKWDD